MDDFTLKKRQVMESMKLEAKNKLDNYSYEVLKEACEDSNGPPELMLILHEIFVSIIEDWIQEYLDSREILYNLENCNINHDLSQ